MDAVASDLISNIEGYQQLLTTLSLGVAAGVFAVLVQIMFHNSEHDQKLKLRWSWLLLVGVVVELLAIGFGVATKSALVSSVPALHVVPWSSASATTSLQAAGLGGIMFWSLLQVSAFFIGIVLLFVVLLRNIKLLRG
jgi:hypothetical protein